MYSLISCIGDTHSWPMVAAAAIICLIGSVTTVLLLSQAQQVGNGRFRGLILAAAALSSGIGIWSTHFIAMLAYEARMPIAYNASLTTFSAVVVVVGCWVAFVIAFRRTTVASCAAGGIVLAAAVTVMHLVGMAALEIQASLHYDHGRLFVAMALALVLDIVAFTLFRQPPGWRRNLAITGFLALSVCCLHFTAMTAAVFLPDPGIAMNGLVLQPHLLATLVSVVSIVLILGAFATVYIDRRFTDLRGFVKASMEGLLIVCDGVVINANERIRELTGRGEEETRGKSLDKLLAMELPALAAMAGGGRSCETELIGNGYRTPVEVFARDIEYHGKQCQVLVIRDLTERKATQCRIEHLAHHDALTDLPNRLLFDTRIHQALQAAASAHAEVALLFLDLDRFKSVNDIFGHAEGDRVLRRVTAMLRDSTGPNDTVARLGGDEFAIIQPDQVQPAAARQLAERILATFAAEMDTGRDPTAVGVSIGIAIYPGDGNGPDQLRNNADMALYRVKHTARGGACFFDADMDLAVRTRRQLEGDLRRAVDRRQLHVCYQPFIALRTGEVTGYEALARWHHPSCGMIEPDVFIPIAEESGSIVQLGEWILEQACLEAVRWRSGSTIAVNISPVQFKLPNLHEVVVRVLARTGLPAHRLELEITEKALAGDSIGVVATLMRLKALGIRIVMDDFGTGYSSLSSLRSFPFDKLKIDRSFILSLEHDVAAQSIVRAIIGLGNSLGIPVVAEGVETDLQRRIVLDEGCTLVQGMLFGKPGIEPSAKPASVAPRFKDVPL